MFQCSQYTLKVDGSVGKCTAQYKTVFISSFYLFIPFTLNGIKAVFMHLFIHIVALSPS